MEPNGSEYVGQSNYSIEESQSAVNSLIIDYYKKFGKQRDLEQFFCLSTAQSDIRDPTSLFWRRMKSQADSSDSGEKKTESSTELCRISIKCSVPEPSTSQDEYKNVKSDSESPIIRAGVPGETSRNSDNESVKSDDVYSQKSIDGTLDTSTNKPFSPTSSITSQRKLEWDSLADVGYGNESDRKNSASSLSTLERLALQQQYSNNDTKQNSELGIPTAQSTPFDVSENKQKNKKGCITKTTKIYNRDIDSVKLNISQNSENKPQPINVNLTKHISFNVEKDGGVTIENISKSVSLSPEKASGDTEVVSKVKMDKEIQTSLTNNKQKSSSSSDFKEYNVKKIPVLISLNTLKKRTRKKRVKKIKRRIKKRQDKKIVPLEKSNEQVSEAESFEYMPGHIYNQNQLNEQNRNNNACGNRSSLESSGGLTTDSSKMSKFSFTKDLETGIDLLKRALENRFDDSKLRKKLIKDVVQRLIKTKYKDDESSTEFLSGLSFDSKKIDLTDNNHTTSSTSDVNNTANKTKLNKPKKSILRSDKFNANAIASTSQSVPNLPILTKDERSNTPNMKKDFSNTDSDLSSKNKNLSDTVLSKTSSEILYKKYLDALKREEAYKKHLKDKEIFLKQKLVGSDNAFDVVRQVDVKAKNNLKDLMNDLIRNNYNDGSGDASKLEGGSNPNINVNNYNLLRKPRSHSVFTLSSSNSDKYTRKTIETQKSQNPCGSTNCYQKSERHYCCCPYHTSHPRVGVTDSSVQVDINSKDVTCPESKATQSSPQELKDNGAHQIFQHKCHNCKTQLNQTRMVNNNAKEDIKYVCLCTGEEVIQEVPENILIYKCSRLTNKYLKIGDNIVSKVSNTPSEHFSSSSNSPRQKISPFNSDDCDKKCLTLKDNCSSNNQTSKSSQTNINLPIKLHSKSSEQSIDSISSKEKIYLANKIKRLDKFMTEPFSGKTSRLIIHEATRCIQTEISINPKISDPALSDINIINDNNCVQLISEYYKEVSQPSSKSNIIKQTIASSGSSSVKSNPIEAKDDSQFLRTNVVVKTTNTVEKLDKEIQSIPVDVNYNAPYQGDKSPSNKFIIPIQGTNMTLKVSLGSEVDNNICEMKTLPNDHNNTTKYTSTGTETVNNNIVENYTSLMEECSKEVQSDSANIFNEFYQQKKLENENKNSDCENIRTHVQENTHLYSKPTVNTCLAESKFNTFPKIDGTNIQKPFLRSNSDTGKMEKSCHVTFNRNNDKETIDAPDVPLRTRKEPYSSITSETQVQSSSDRSENNNKGKTDSEAERHTDGKSSNVDTDTDTKVSASKDPLINIIQDITRRYSKNDIEKSKRKKCFKEIITFLNYLLDTDETTDHERNKTPPTSDTRSCEEIRKASDKLMDRGKCNSSPKKTYVDKSIQLSIDKSKSHKPCTDSSELPMSTEIPTTSSDSATCKVLNKIKRECDKYHQKRCKTHSREKCEASSSTSVNCDQCRRVHHCSCRSHKCKNHKAKKIVEKKKKCVAYNLIIQTSDSVVSEEITCDSNRQKLQNIIVKVPSKRKVANMPFKEVSKKIEHEMPHCSPRSKNYRSKSLPNDSEISSTDNFLKKTQVCTVKEYLEKNRPDFVEKSSNRQHCLKLINETRPRECGKPRLNMIVVHNPSCAINPCLEVCDMCYKGIPIDNCNPCVDPYMHCIQNEVTRIANERAAKRQLLSLQLDRHQALSALSEMELKQFAKVLGHELRRKTVAPKFISEREMKKHSQKIYKSLPEVVRKKEEIKKEKIKKTNLLMADIFKKNLQKKTLQGAVNLSNYSTVIKI